MTIDLKTSVLQGELFDTFAPLFAKCFASDAVRQAEPIGHDGAGWSELCGMGGLEVGIPGSGESESGLPELAVLAELVGRHLAPVPYAEASAAVRLLAELHHDLTPEVLAGRRIVTVAPWGVGESALVPAGAVADSVLAMRDGALVLWDGEGTHVPNLGGAPLGRVVTRGAAQCLLDGKEAARAWDQLIDEWRLLLASALTGLAARALEIGVEQAKTRQQFGAPIGSYQGVSHRLADIAVEVDAARLVTAKALWARDLQRVDARRLTEMAWVQSAAAAVAAAEAAVHFLGGYGITVEYDAQLYFRRAKAWVLLGGGRAAGIRRLAREIES